MNTFTSGSLNTITAITAGTSGNAISFPPVYITNTTSGSYPNLTNAIPAYTFKVCRDCFHAHIAGQKGCIIQNGWNMEYIPCPCDEYKPKDNLEYLEWCFDKKNK